MNNLLIGLGTLFSFFINTLHIHGYKQLVVNANVIFVLSFKLNKHYRFNLWYAFNAQIHWLKDSESSKGYMFEEICEKNVKKKIKHVINIVYASLGMPSIKNPSSFYY